MESKQEAEAGSNSSMTDKHAVECSKAAFLDINLSVCDV